MTWRKRMEFVILLALLTSPCYGQKFSFGNCPTVTSATGLTFDMMAATWREYARTPSIHIHNWRCTLYTITLVTANVMYSVRITAQDKITGNPVSVLGSFTPGGATGATTLASSFITIRITRLYTSKTADYYIIAGVDAVYLVLYSCENVPFGKLESAIILTAAAATTATSAQIQTALDALYAVGYPRHGLRRGYQGCID